MFKYVMLVSLFCASLSNFAQDDLSSQLLIIKELMPSATRLGLLYNPSHSNEQALNEASAASGLVIIKSPVNNMRDMTNAIRSLAKYEVDFIYMADDKIVTGAQTIKFVVKQTMRKKVPVFTSSPNSFKGGAYGWLVANGSSWQIKINGKISGRFDIQIPDSGLFVVEE